MPLLVTKNNGACNFDIGIDSPWLRGEVLRSDIVVGEMSSLRWQQLFPSLADGQVHGR
jgi:hypothetical protein